MKHSVVLGLLLGILTGCLALALTTRVARAAEPTFGAWWHDGKAELDGYRLTVQRYGHARTGRAVAIYVTEPFSRSKHVKLDDPTKTPTDAIDAFKLNLVRDFQTGIYDYHTIVSLFDGSADLAPLKIAFSSSEWCGQVYEELNVAGGSITQRVSSYFAGESAERTLDLPAGGIEEDNLFVLLRGLNAPMLRPGEKHTYPFLAGPFYRRLAHRPTAWASASIERLSLPQRVTVPAGAFDVDVFVVRPADGREGRFDVERAYPHRIVRWKWKPTLGAGPLGGTDAGELSGSTRLDYWRTHDPGDERYLRQLGVEALLR